jgi:hypothetical protein
MGEAFRGYVSFVNPQTSSSIHAMTPFISLNMQLSMKSLYASNQTILKGYPTVLQLKVRWKRLSVVNM